MWKIFVVSLRVALVTLLVTGAVYPLIVTVVANVLFPDQAHGSVVAVNSEVVGSALIGQRFVNPAYLESRPSAAGDGWDASASSGSNLGPTSRKLQERVLAEQARQLMRNPDAEGPVPDELVTTSGSGLDPHISPATAEWQAPRIAKARGIDVERVRSVLREQVERRDLGFLGEPRVSVLLANLALDRHFGTPTK